jgi:hypothetical protein
MTDGWGPRRRMLLHALEAAIDALAAAEDIPTSAHHWRRGEIAEELYERNILPADESGLVRALNEQRKGFAYDGDEPDFGADGFESIYERVEAVVETAEESR